MRKRYLLSVLLVLLLFYTGCKKITVAKVNSYRIKFLKTNMKNSKPSAISKDISFEIEKRLLLNKGRESGRFEDKKLLDYIEKVKPSICFNFYIGDIRKDIIIPEEEIKKVFENNPLYKGQKYDGKKDLIKSNLVSERIFAKMLKLKPELEKKHKIEIKKEYLDFQKYPPTTTSLVIATIDDKYKITNNEINNYLRFQKNKKEHIEIEDALNYLIARQLIYIDSRNKYINSKRLKSSVNQFMNKQVFSYMKYRYIYEKNPINNETTKKFYEEQKDKLYSQPKKVRVRQILFDNEEKDIDPQKKAKEILDTIFASKKPQELFRKLAREYQKGPEILKDLAGDLGPISENVMPEPFTKATFSLKKGEIYKDIIHTDEYGYHLIMCEEVLPPVVEPYDQKIVTKDMKRYIKDVKYKEFLSELADNADIRIYYKDYKGGFKKYEEK